MATNNDNFSFNANTAVNMVEQQVTVYYQRSTTNKSFIEMSEYLKSRGIKNYRFMLILLDPDLAQIDPHDPNLSFIMKQKVVLECRRNPWYFFREVVRIPASGEPSKFILNRGNMAFLFLTMMNINTMTILSRQTGKSIGAACWTTYVFNFATTNSQISLLNKEQRDSKLNLARIRAIRDLLPTYLRFDAIYSEVNGKKVKVSNTTTFLENAITHNKLKTYGKARNQISAANLLRGETFNILWADETAFIAFMKDIYTNMIPAMSKATAIAKANNVPYGIMFTTTPGFLTTEEGKWSFQVMNNSTKFNEMWYDLSYYQIRNIVDSNRMSNFVVVQFSYQQLGYSEEWFAERVRESNWDWISIRREYLLEWSNESENCPFTKEELDTIAKFCKEPKKCLMILGKYPLQIFEEIPLKANLVPKYPPIIGVDPSGGMSRDFSAITIIDSKTTKVFAELRSNTISLIDLARVIEYIVLNLMPNAVVTIERNGGYGSAVIGKLKETKVKPNLYYEMKEKIVEEQTINGQIYRTNKLTKVYGVQSTMEVRNQLIELLRERVNYHKDKFISKTILEEMRGMETKKNGRVEHSDMTHDDSTFSMLHALFVWYNGRNLKENFGIEKYAIKTDDYIDDEIEMASGAKEEADMAKHLERFNATTNMNTISSQVALDLAQMNKSKGMLFSEFVAQQRKGEEDHLRMMLQDERAKDAYARFYGVHPDNVDPDLGRSSYSEVEGNMPSSIFTDFNKDPEEMENGSIYRTMPSFMGQYGSGDDFSNIEDESQQ